MDYPKKPIKICVCSYYGAGKDTIADLLAPKRSFTQIAIADSLKIEVADITKIPLKVLKGKTLEDRTERDKVTAYHVKSGRFLTGRQWLEEYGKEKRMVTPSYWLDKTLPIVNFMEIEGRNIIVTDVRFFNEEKAFRQKGFKFIRINRASVVDPISPKLFDIDHFKYDAVVDNDSTIEEFYETFAKKMDSLYTREHMAD